MNSARQSTANAPTDVVGREGLQARIDRLPRVRLGHLPTPLDPCPRLSAALGGPDIFVKRDDATGIAFGGNKVRQHEFIFPQAVAQGADTIVIGAGTQSNWCRQATAAAAKLGMKAVLLLVHGQKGPAKQGNLLLDLLMDADVTIIPGNDLEILDPLLEAKAEELRRQGRKPYVFAGPDVQARAAVGYANAMLEIDAQVGALGRKLDHLVLCGADVTPAGLNVGARALGLSTRVAGFSPIRWKEERDVSIAHLANLTCGKLDLRPGFTAADILNDDGQIGAGYGILSEAALEAMRLVARTEGLILDPVYTSKAMAGLIAEVRAGRMRKGETVVFLHTGGTPALFAYGEDLGLGEVTLA